MDVTGKVTHTNVAEGWMDVVVDRPSCGSCSQSAGCLSAGTSLASESNPLRVPLLKGAVVGDSLLLRAPEGSIGRGALLAYGMPLMLGIGCALAVAVFLPDAEWAAPLGCVIGLAIGFLKLWFTSGRLAEGALAARHCEAAND